MKKLAILSLACLVVLAGVTVAQDCTGCDESKAKAVKVAKVAKQEKKECCDASKPLSAQIAALEVGAAKGCEKSKARLAALNKACGTECTKTMKATVAKYEKYAKGGCDQSAKALTAMTASLQVKKVEKPLLSTRVAALTKYSKAGCDTSKATLAKLLDGCKSNCTTTLVNDIKKLEGHAGKGCKTSATKLAAFESKLPAAKTTKVSKAPDHCSGTGTCPATGEGATKPAAKKVKSDCGSCDGATKPAAKKIKSDCGSCDGATKPAGLKVKKAECSGSKSDCGSGTKL